ncbi:hypothetical protein [Phenylobacterium ferrooxidans]|uniref:Lipoprotein n=1 Tax=Phenylobacterium ferrooxidans TaxID=2982689 RepID=A0ABW6CNM3_9CAUL
MINLERSITHVVTATALALSLAACEQKPTTEKGSKAAQDAAPAAASAISGGEGESETQAGLTGKTGDDHPYDARGGMERGREARARAHGMGMAPSPDSPADNHPQ